MTESAPAKKSNPSLQKRAAARMAAVQCLYTLSVGGEKLSPAQQVIILQKQLGHNREEQKLRSGMAVEPNYKLVQNILEGIDKWRPDIDRRLDGILDGDWKRERMSPLLLAILQCGIFEMFFDKDVNPKIIIDEYTRLGRSFFADHEISFIHAALNRLANQRHA